MISKRSIEMTPRARRCCARRRFLPLLSACALVGLAAGFCPAQEPAGADGRPLRDLARVKEQEAREKLERLEETMDQLARLLAATEPQNAAKLRTAFRQSRARLLREGMDRIVKYLAEKKIDQAIEEQKSVTVNLEEILAILLEKDIDPRELLKHIRRLRDIVKDLDKVVQQETKAKMASGDAAQAKSTSDALAKDLAKLEDLIRRQKQLEKDAAAVKDAASEKLGGLAPTQEKVRRETGKLRQGDAARPAEGSQASGETKPGEGKPGEGKPGEGKPGEGKPGAGKPGAGKPATPPQPDPEQALNRKALQRAEEQMKAATDAMRGRDAPAAREATAKARAALEDALSQASDKLEKLRARRNFKKMKKDQDATRKKTDDVALRMRKPPPLVATPEGTVPGQAEVEKSAADMQGASQSLGQGKGGESSAKQKKALAKLKEGRKKAEEALEQLQRAFRDRLLAYLREKFTVMLSRQRKLTLQTRSLDLKLRALRLTPESAGGDTAEVDREDRQLAQALSSGEKGITLLADDVLDVLTEDGTTLAFPRVVQEIKDDILNVAGLLARIETGERTQYLQRQIEAAIEDILRALEQARKNPPPPNPNQGRKSKSGAGPLLPLSSELKLVRTLQRRVNDRTRQFDRARQGAAEPTPEEKLQLHSIARKQKQVEKMLRDLARAIGER